MNLFTPSKYAKGNLVGIDGNAFSIMTYFRDRAIACSWSKDDIEKVTKQAQADNYDHLIATINAHLTTDLTKIFSSDLIEDQAEYLEKLEKIKSKYSSNPESETYILIDALVAAIKDKSEFSDKEDDANSVMNYFCYYTNIEIRKLILLFGTTKDLSLKERNIFYSRFTPLITNHLTEHVSDIKFIVGDDFSMSDWGGNFYKNEDE